MSRHALEDAAAAVVAAALHVLPRRVALLLGAALGRLVGELDRKHLGIAADNLRRAFPDWTEARTFATARAVYAHFGRVLFDILWMRGRTREEILGLVAEVVGREHVEAAMGRGRGAVLITGHFGNWELHGLVHGYLFGPIAVVARPLDNPGLDRRLCALRAQAGNTVIYKQRALARVLRLLRERRAVAVLIDQNVQEKDGIFVEFFGRPAATTTVAAALALKTGCPVLACRAELRADGRYRVVYDPPFEPRPSGDRVADIAAMTQDLTRAIEGWVRQAPGQWLWIHRRWKTQPRAAEPAPRAAAVGES